MIQTRKALIIALLIPILSLATLTAYREYVLSFGEEVILPISGYDPRDLLSGHYLSYQIDYGVKGICAENSGQKVGYVCLEPKMFSYTTPKGCAKLICGVCNHNRFEAGIEKYYVSKDKMKNLEKQLRLKKVRVVLSVTSRGQAQVKDLLVNGQSWKKG